MILITVNGNTGAEDGDSDGFHKLVEIKGHFFPVILLLRMFQIPDSEKNS